MSPRTYVVGAGLAGLSCAVRLARAGRVVEVYEAAGHAGGRCRSFFEPALDRTIDNGNHLLLSGNTSTLAYLEEIGAGDSLAGPGGAAFPFLDLASGERWTVRPNGGRLPWWILSPDRRVPATRPGDYVAGLRLARAQPADTVAACLDSRSALFRRFWEPMCVAALNAAPEEASAALLWPVLRDTFARGAAACRPLIARRGLGDSFVEPALRLLQSLGAAVHFNRRVRALSFEAGGVIGIDAGEARLALEAADSLVLAVPPPVAASLVPGLAVPDASRAIVNGHFRLERTAPEVTFLGLVGGTCQWLFVRDAIASVTVSAADRLADEPAAAIAARLWPEVTRALALGAAPLPAHRIVKEKRATFAQIPAEVGRRPPPRTAWHNLYLAGDWTDTGLPATIEGAVRSGQRAAALVLAAGRT